MARPRRKTFTMAQYLQNVKDGYITNNASTQRNPAWKPIIDGLAVTTLTDDYIPPLILSEEECGRTVIVDGGSRTAAFMTLRYGNYKIKSSVENPIIKYKKMDKDDNGRIVWRDAEFDIRNKTYEQFPKELQKMFDEYQVETVIHEGNADMYLRRYNIHTSMNANQKMFVYLPQFAEHIRNIASRNFFINYCDIKDNEKEKGMLERIISESVMCMFHFDKWNKNGKKLATYLNENSNEEEFDTLNSNLERLENIVTDTTKILFNSKDCFVWFTLFNKFTKTRFDDSKFEEFLIAFIEGLRNKAVDEKLFEECDKVGSTKDKKVIEAKLHILETLMNEFLHINNTSDENKTELNETVNLENNTDDKENNNIENEGDNNESILQFVKEYLDKDTTLEDINMYKDCLEDYMIGVPLHSRIREEGNMKSLVAFVAYICKYEIDDEVVINFFEEYAKNNTTYMNYQPQNYERMVKKLKEYIENNNVNSVA